MMRGMCSERHEFIIKMKIERVDTCVQKNLGCDDRSHLLCVRLTSQNLIKVPKMNKPSFETHETRKQFYSPQCFDISKAASDFCSVIISFFYSRKG